MTEYSAGSCNIGPAEIKRRQKVALVGLVLFLISLVGAFSPHATHMTRLGVFLPALIFATGFVQARKKFCLAFGLAGTFNFANLGNISKVQSPEERKADRKTAISILLQAVALAVAMTLFVVFSPLQ